MSSLFRIHTWSLQWPSCGYIQWLILRLCCIWPFHSIWPSVKMWVFCWCVFLFSLASSTPDRDGFIPTSLIHCLLFILIFFLGLYIPAYFVILECLQFSYRPSYLFCIYFLILSSRFLVYLYNIHGMMNPVQTSFLNSRPTHSIAYLIWPLGCLLSFQLCHSSHWIDVDFPRHADGS